CSAITSSSTPARWSPRSATTSQSTSPCTHGKACTRSIGQAVFMTVRTLILLRHAKAANPDDYSTDIERPLSPRGHRDAAAAGSRLRDEGLRPDAVLCSTAVRTRETLRELGLGDVPVGYERRIYVGPAADTLELLRSVEADVATLLIIGHNPT